MKLIRVSLALAIAAITGASAATVAPNYKIVERIKLPDGGFDYATYDAATGHILMARANFTSVIDVKTNSATQLNSAINGHIALTVPGTTLVVLAQRSGTVRIVDAAKDIALGDDIRVGDNPDGAVYDPLTKLVYVANHGDGIVTAIDPVALKAVAIIMVGGELEFPVSDGAGKVFVNIESAGEIGVIDVKTNKLTGKYKLDNCEEPTGLAYIANLKLLMASCRNHVAKVIEAATGKEIASVPIGLGPDAVIYDANRKLAFIPCGGDGVLEVIDVSDPAHIAVVQHVKTQPGSRTGTLDPATGRLYLMASNPDPNPPAGVRNARLAGSFEALVIAP